MRWEVVCSPGLGYRREVGSGPGVIALLGGLAAHKHLLAGGFTSVVEVPRAREGLVYLFFNVTDVPFTLGLSRFDETL